MQIQTYLGPALLTLATVALYYGFMIRLLMTKTRLVAEYKSRGEKFDRYFGQDREMLAADRLQLNLLEHMPPFFVLLWMNAVFVSVRWSTMVGAVWVGSRLLYPFLLGGRLGREVRASIFVATLPGYLVIATFAGSLIAKLGGLI